MRRLIMQKWIGYIAVTVLFFFSGLTLRQTWLSPKTSPATIINHGERADVAAPAQEIFKMESDLSTPEDHLRKPAAFSAVSDESCKKIHDDIAIEKFPEMFARLSSADPLEALHVLEAVKIEDAGLKDSLYKTLAYSWSLQDPQAAYQWMVKLKNEIPKDTFDHSLSTILRQLVKTDPQTAASALSHISSTSILEATLPRMAREWAQNDPISAFNWLETLQASEQVSNDALSYSYSEMMREYVKIDPQAAAGIIIQLESKRLKGSLLYNVAGEWANQDLDAALRWAGSLNDDETKTQGFAAIIKAQVYEQPATIVNALLDHPDLRSDDQNLLSSAFQRLSEKDAELAYGILLQQPDAVQEQLAMPFAYGLGFQGENLLAEYINSQPPGHMQDAAVKAMVELNIDEDPVTSFDWLSKMNDVEKRDRLMREMARIAPADQLPEIKEKIERLDINADQRLILDELISNRIQEEYSELIIPKA